MKIFAMKLSMSLAGAMACFAPSAGKAFEGPECNDEEVLEFVIDAFNTAQQAENKSAVLLEALNGVREIGTAQPAGGDWRQLRNCSAQARLSNGETIAGWHQIRLPRVNDAIGYRVKLCFAKYDRISGGNCAAFSRPPS